MAVTMEQFTPRSVIAGRLGGSQGRSVATVVRAAAAVLGTAQVAIICATEKDVVWYLAAPASDLASHLQSVSALAAALPHTAEHKGDGAYVTDIDGGLQAVVVKLADKFQSYVGTPAMVQRFAVMEGATSTHVCTATGMPWTFPSRPKGGRAASIASGLTVAGLMVALVASGVWMWAASQVTAYEQASEDNHVVQQVAVKTAVQSLAANPYPVALTHLQQAVEQSAREGGTLVQFEHKDGHSTWSLNINNQIVNRSAH
jgi:hypothetical protein